MAKFITDFTIINTVSLTPKYQLLTLQTSAACNLSEIKPGQFVQVRIDNQSTFLRRPISIHDVDASHSTITLLVNRAGEGSNWLCNQPANTIINIMWPLGNGFSIPANSSTPKILLIGGGVGVAPLLYLGKTLKDNGFNPIFLLAARTASDLLQLDSFAQLGQVYVSTDDGTTGEKGLVTQNSVLNSDIDLIYCCGPMPMMKAVAQICHNRSIECLVSLENVMACGIGACLCCVEKTVKGNRCVCTEGPVFNINELTW